MKHQVFAVYDAKAENFGMPIYMHNKGEALRAFTDQANDGQSMISKHPEDFTLFHLGEFESSTGIHVPLTTPASLGLAIEFKQEA